MNSIKKIIAEKITNYFVDSNLTVESILEIFDTPPDPSMGDIALACFKLSKALRKSPSMIAGELADMFSASVTEGISKI